MPAIFNQFTLPDLFAVSTAFKDTTNPHWKRASIESKSWVNSYHVFSDRRRAFFLQGQSELLVSHAYPYADYEEFRTCCDFVNLLFVVDEISDEQTPEDARLTGEVYLNVMRNPKWDDGSKLAQITRDFRARLTRTIKPETFRRFLQHSQDYIDCVVEEAKLREHGAVLDLDSYEIIRRENSAVRLCFGLIPYVLGMELPEEVFADPVFKRIYFAGVDMVCWANDVYSYNMEVAKGLDGNNFMTVLMKTRGMTIQKASDYAGEHYKKLMDGFVADKARLPSFGPSVDGDVTRYIESMQHWPVGNLYWSFETPRYFGAQRDQIRETRVVYLKTFEEDD
ncbi:hypothetical protein EW146_g5932 [Bondarzewia mesenterica]|uniref:Terpene synthase n=1 Tax=Bondarzewia mesenterica TaxID=1095465 RepID=A0A4S4LRW2_9AGAM|nr:hypothetical protein EW146_g5932 [Bondarzewia mesenterica]